MKKTLVADLLAGLTVSFAALSLGAAFGIMSGRGAFAGMLGAAIIPIIASIFGGTRIQASGPTAPMTAITALLVAKAYDNFSGDKQLVDEYITLVLIMASVFIVLTGVLKLGKYIKLVPQVVVLGFMNGIGVLIWLDQLKKLKVPAKILRFVPSIFVTILLLTFITSYFHINVQHVSLGESYSSFREYMHVVFIDFPVDKEIFRSELLIAAFPIALQLCLLAYLDSLLTSLVIDKMTKETTKPDKELIAQGLANGITGLLQGIPGAQATIRSVLLIKEGAQTRLAGVFVGVFALLGFVFFGQQITLISSAVFVGVLLKAGLDVFDRDFAIAYVKNRWVSNRKRNIQLFFVLYTTLITVIFDLNVAVISGTIFYYIGKKYFKVIDAEDCFSEVVSDEILGNQV